MFLIFSRLAANCGCFQWIVPALPAWFMLNVGTPSDDRNLALLPLLLGLLNAPDELPEFALCEMGPGELAAVCVCRGGGWGVEGGQGKGESQGEGEAPAGSRARLSCCVSHA